MNLKILLPFRIFEEWTDVTRLVVDTAEGSFGLLPHRLDCVAPLIPGILIFQREKQPESYVAIDRGILVKAGPNVTVSVRQAISGVGLAELRTAMEKQFLTLDQQEQLVRTATAKLESGLVRRLASMHDE